MAMIPIRKSLVKRMQTALETDNSIIATRNDLEEGKVKPVTTEYLESLGLSKADLKKLYNWGFASKLYTKNFWAPGETLPNNKVADTYYRGKGHRVAWILLANEELEGSTK